jgi:hypothetical protein
VYGNPWRIDLGPISSLLGTQAFNPKGHLPICTGVTIEARRTSDIVLQILYNVERATGIEPVSKAWEARNKNLETFALAALRNFKDRLNWKMNGK